MAYKDKDRQREANRARQRRYRRDRAKGVTLSEPVTIAPAQQLISANRRDRNRPYMSQNQLNYMKMRKEQESR